MAAMVAATRAAELCMVGIMAGAHACVRYSASTNSAVEFCSASEAIVGAFDTTHFGDLARQLRQSDLARLDPAPAPAHTRLRPLPPQTAFLTLDEALKVTNRRVNALENVVKPKLENTISYIKGERLAVVGAQAGARQHEHSHGF